MKIVGCWLLCGAIAAPAVGESGQFIASYTNRRSFEAGEVIDFYVSTVSPTYKLEIMRQDPPNHAIVARFDGLEGALQPTNRSAWRDGAGWNVSLSVQVPADWETGSYLARFTTEEGTRKYCPFVIRPVIPGATSRIAFIANYATRQAYDEWGGS